LFVTANESSTDFPVFGRLEASGDLLGDRLPLVEVFFDAFFDVVFIIPEMKKKLNILIKS